MRWNNVFLTGATGFFGAHILCRLLDAGTGHVTCHVRNGGTDRVAESLCRNGLWRETFAERISAVTGDLTEPNLGLGAEFETLSRRCDAVIHNGANVNYILNFKQLRAANVVATQDALRIAEAADAPFLFVSTLRLFDHRVDGTPIRETDPIDPGQAVRIGYARSKMMSERLVAAAANRGLRTAVFRPGLMCGDGQIGAPNPQDAVTLLIRACVTLGAAPDSPMQINCTSVTYGAMGLVSLGVDDPGATWHLVNDTPTLMTDVLRLLSDCGYEVPLIPYETWVARLRDSLDGTDLAPLADHFTLSFPEETTRRVFDSALTRGALSARGIVHPEIDDAFWAANIRGMARAGVLPEPQALKAAS